MICSGDFPLCWLFAPCKARIHLPRSFRILNVGYRPPCSRAYQRLFMVDSLFSEQPASNSEHHLARCGTSLKLSH
jgi:hypothetical protein